MATPRCWCCDEDATMKDDHDRDCCAVCWEEMSDWICPKCDGEFKGYDDDCCPHCGHHPKYNPDGDAEDWVGRRDDDEEEEEKTE